MSSVKCPECKLTNWATAITCKRCGTFLKPGGESTVVVAGAVTVAAVQGVSAGQAVETNHQSAQPISNYEPQPQWSPQPQQPASPGYGQDNYGQQGYQYQGQPQRPAYYQQSNYQYHHPADVKTGIAIASMVLGILGMVTSIFLFGLIFCPIGLILGIIALVKANKKPETYGGKGFAITGIVTSGMMVLFVPIVAAIAIPNLMAARRAANEGSAISSMKTLANAEVTYMATTAGKCGDVQTLIATKMVDVSYAKPEKNGYRLLVTSLPGACEITATPLTPSHGTRSFYYSTAEGILRAGAKNGKPADKSDSPVSAESPNGSTQYQKTSAPYSNSY